MFIFAGYIKLFCFGCLEQKSLGSAYAVSWIACYGSLLYKFPCVYLFRGASTGR